MRRGLLFLVLAVLTASAAKAEPKKIIGIVDLRPSWSSSDGKVIGENLVEAGYRLDPKISLSYQQQFISNIYNGTKSGGFDNSLFDGYARAKFNDLWSPREYNLFFSYEVRAYAPTHEPKRKNGLVTMIRNYFKVRSQISSGFALQYLEVPIVHFYSQPGADGAANPFFENRFYFGPELSWLQGKLVLFLPFMLSNTRHSDFQPTAKNNASWTHHLDFYPELVYQLTPNVGLGVAYYTSNLLAPDFSGLDLKSGFEKGTTQLVFQLSL